MEDVLVRVEGRAGRITLNRPRVLNALSHAMAGAIATALDAWEGDPAVALVLIDGAGERAFCSGGDLAQIWEAARRGDFACERRFWADEYRLNARIARYPKPYVALMHGFVMGSGVGVSAHGSHRVVGESAAVAMPECAIGLVPDVGGTHLLAKAPGRLGEYLGLTGARMGPEDAIVAGFADSFVPEAEWPALAAELAATGDPAAIAARARPAPAGALGALREVGRLEGVVDRLAQRQRRRPRRGNPRGDDRPRPGADLARRLRPRPPRGRGGDAGAARRRRSQLLTGERPCASASSDWATWALRWRGTSPPPATR